MPETHGSQAISRHPDFYFERFTRTLSDPNFETVRHRGPVGFTADDHDYCQQNKERASRIREETGLWGNRYRPSRRTRVLRLPFRRRSLLDAQRPPHADPVGQRNHAAEDQARYDSTRDWLESKLATTGASLAVVYSADIFASRPNPDCFLFGWPDEYRRLMTAFMDAQLRGVRVAILSGDAHGLRIHHHPDPAARAQAAGLWIVGFVCSGLSPGSWELRDRQRPHRRPAAIGHASPRPGHDGHRSAGTPGRSVTLRAISGDQSEPDDLSQPSYSTTHPPGQLAAARHAPPAPAQ